jgi:uncharacterized Ntn-hydrolase superfamily protein
MNYIQTTLFALLFTSSAYKSQDTFSILGFDSVTHEVGAAGASCVDLFTAPGLGNDFICELLPDTGAIACQAAYLPQNQKNARNRMRQGDSPAQLISWLVANDAGGSFSSNSTHRQYGVLKRKTWPHTAAFTGTNCMDYKSHRVGPDYTIHGNILLGAEVLDSMEANYKRATGGLACKLMAAMQGAKMIGADSRCAGNLSSSLFAFLKVSLPTDTFGKPSFIVSLKTHNGDMIEPIDSLQFMFDRKKNCSVSTTGLTLRQTNTFKFYPNPTQGPLHLKNEGSLTRVQIVDFTGRLLREKTFSGSVIWELNGLEPGAYILRKADGSAKIQILFISP